MIACAITAVVVAVVIVAELVVDLVVVGSGFLVVVVKSRKRQTGNLSK